MINKETLFALNLQKLSQPDTRDQLLESINVLVRTRKFDIYDPRIGEVVAGVSLLVDTLQTVDKRNNRQLPLDLAAISHDTLGFDFNHFNQMLTGVIFPTLAVERLLEAAQQTQSKYRRRWQDLSRKVQSGEITKVAEQTTQGERISWSDDRRRDYVWELRMTGIRLALKSVGIDTDSTKALIPGINIDTDTITSQVMNLPDEKSYLQKLAITK